MKNLHFLLMEKVSSAINCAAGLLNFKFMVAHVYTLTMTNGEYKWQNHEQLYQQNHQQLYHKVPINYTINSQSPMRQTPVYLQINQNHRKCRLILICNRGDRQRFFTISMIGTQNFIFHSELLNISRKQFATKLKSSKVMKA